MDGHWIKTDSVDDIRSGEWRNGKVSAAILLDATKKCAILMDGDKVSEVNLIWYSRSFTDFMVRMEPFRDFSNWQGSHM